MRIATAQYQSVMNRSLQTNQEKLTSITQQMASSQRIQLPSEDPIGAVRMSRLSREESMITQYRDNISQVKNRMFSDENYLSSMVTDMNQGRDLMVWAVDGANTPDDLNAMVVSLGALRDSLFYTANTIDQEGRYLFSGTASNTAAVTFDPAAPAGARYSYTGNTESQIVIVGNGITQAANVNLDGVEALLNQMDAAIGELSATGVDANDPAVRPTLTGALDGFDSAIQLVSLKIAVSGGAQKILGTLENNHANVSLSNKMALTQIGQLDYGLAATDLNGYTTALQSTYKAYSKVGTLSLFDML